MKAEDQLSALSHLDELFGQHGIEYWLFGGWAVDFHAGKVTRPHDDLDLAVRSHDGERVRELLTAAGWRHTPEEGYSVYELAGVRLEVAFLDEPTLEITQEELAATLALSRQTVSRAFHDLASEGAIKPERRRVRLLDLEKLREHLPR